MYQFDVAVIGAGVVGLSVAARVARSGAKLLILEKNETFGQETSSRNSGVVHAGFYYPEGSLKARLCVEGNATLRELCGTYGIPLGSPGKLVVATNSNEEGQLQALWEQGQRNGVPGLRLVSGQELRSLEPNVKGVAALFSATTGITDPHAVASFFLQQAKDSGATIVYRSEVVGIEPAHAGYKVTIRDRSGLSSFVTTVVVNSAGLHADRIARLAGMDPNTAGYRLHYCKGEYFRLGPSWRGVVTRLVYPVPEPQGAGLGIHVTLSLDGEVRLGPNTRYVDGIDYQVDDSQKPLFCDSARRLLPQIQYDDLQPDFAGIRPKLQGPGDGFRDFVIRDEADRGLPGLVNLVGIESPGLTASSAIGKYVEGMLAQCH